MKALRRSLYNTLNGSSSNIGRLGDRPAAVYGQVHDAGAFGAQALHAIETSHLGSLMQRIGHAGLYMAREQGPCRTHHARTDDDSGCPVTPQLDAGFDLAGRVSDHGQAFTALLRRDQGVRNVGDPFGAVSMAGRAGNLMATNTHRQHGATPRSEGAQ